MEKWINEEMEKWRVVNEIVVDKVAKVERTVAKIEKVAKKSMKDKL